MKIRDLIEGDTFSAPQFFAGCAQLREKGVTPDPRYLQLRIERASGNDILIAMPDDLVEVHNRIDPDPVWKAEPAKLVPESGIDDYEVKIVFNDGTKTALYFKELDFIKDLGWTNVDRIVITPRWR